MVCVASCLDTAPPPHLGSLCVNLAPSLGAPFVTCVLLTVCSDLLAQCAAFALVFCLVSTTPVFHSQAGILGLEVSWHLWASAPLLWMLKPLRNCSMHQKRQTDVPLSIPSACARAGQVSRALWFLNELMTLIAYLSIHDAVLSCVLLFAIPWTAARQVSLSVDLSRPESWNGLPFPPPAPLTPVSCVSCIGRQGLQHRATGMQGPLLLLDSTEISPSPNCLLSCMITTVYFALGWLP